MVYTLSQGAVYVLNASHDALVVRVAIVPSSSTSDLSSFRPDGIMISGLKSVSREITIASGTYMGQ